MTLIGYTMVCERAGQKQLVRDVALADQAGFDFAVISDHYFPWLEARATPRTPEACWARPLRNRPHSPDDVRHLPDPPLSPRRRRAEGGHHAAALRRPVHPRPRRGRESQRAHHRRAMAAGRSATRNAPRGRRDHPGAAGGRQRDLPGQAFRRRIRQGLGPAGYRLADRHRGIGPGQLPPGGTARRCHNRRRGPGRARLRCLPLRL